VVASALSIRAEGRNTEADVWRQDVVSYGGQPLDVRIEIENKGNVVLRDPIVRMNLSPGTTIARDSLTFTGAAPDKPPVDGASLPEGGVELGDISVGELVRVSLRLQLPEGAPGTIHRQVAVVSVLGLNEYYNTLAVTLE
jgi:hypothetical protein